MEAFEKAGKIAEPIIKGLFTLPPYNSEGPRLIGAACVRCHRKFFPPPFVCPDCLGKLEEVQLPTQGILHSFTIVRVKAPYGLPLPYGLGYVDLEGDELRILTLLDPHKVEDLKIGMHMELRIIEIGDDGMKNPALRYLFTPKEEKRP